MFCMHVCNFIDHDELLFVPSHGADPHIGAVALPQKVLSPNVSAGIFATAVGAPSHATCVLSRQQFHRRPGLGIQYGVFETSESNAHLWVLW